MKLIHKIINGSKNKDNHISECGIKRWKRASFGWKLVTCKRCLVKK